MFLLNLFMAKKIKRESEFILFSKRRVGKTKTRSADRLKKISKVNLWKYIFILLIIANLLIWGFDFKVNLSGASNQLNIASSKKIFENKQINILKNDNKAAAKSPQVTKTPNNQEPKKEEVKQTAVIPEGFCLNVPVIFYHHIEPMDQAKKEGHAQLTVDSGMFEQHIQYLLGKGYRTISAEDLANALISHQQISGKPIVITIDDGYIDAYSYAYPIAKKYNVILNLMIPTGLMENPDYLTWNDLREMVGSGLVFAYDHTWSHASLGGADYSKAEKEIVTAKTQLEQQLGRQVRIFTYPYGSSNQNTINVLRNNSFIAAFTTNPGFYQCDSFILDLHRNRIGDAPLSYFGL